MKSRSKNSFGLAKYERSLCQTPSKTQTDTKNQIRFLASVRLSFCLFVRLRLRWPLIRFVRVLTVADDLNSMGLRLRVYGGDRLKRDRLIGEKIILFSSLDLDELEEQSQGRKQSLEHLVELEPRSNIEVCRCDHVFMFPNDSL